MAKVVKSLRVDPVLWSEIESFARDVGITTNSAVEGFIHRGLADPQNKEIALMAVVAAGNVPAGQVIRAVLRPKSEFREPLSPIAKAEKISRPRKIDDPSSAKNMASRAASDPKPRGRPRRDPDQVAADIAAIPSAHAIAVGPVTPQAGSRLKGPKAEKRTKWK